MEKPSADLKTKEAHRSRQSLGGQLALVTLLLSMPALVEVMLGN